MYKRQDVSCRISDREIFSYDEMPDYILAVDEESRRIVFVNISASRVPQSGQMSVLPSALERAGVLP